MESQGYHQIPFESCKVPESQNYIEKLNFGVNINFAPINTRLNLLVSDTESTTADPSTSTAPSTPDPATTPTDAADPADPNTSANDNTSSNGDSSGTDGTGTPTNSASQRVLESRQSKEQRNRRPAGEIFEPGQAARVHGRCRRGSRAERAQHSEPETGQNGPESDRRAGRLSELFAHSALCQVQPGEQSVHFVRGGLPLRREPEQLLGVSLQNRW